MIGVAVVGSLHLDIMVQAPRLPALDETLMGSGWHYKCGGKGGNQAVAAARLAPAQLSVDRPAMMISASACALT